MYNNHWFKNFQILFCLLQISIDKHVKRNIRTLKMNIKRSNENIICLMLKRGNDLFSKTKMAAIFPVVSFQSINISCGFLFKLRMLLVSKSFHFLSMTCLRQCRLRKHVQLYVVNVRKKKIIIKQIYCVNMAIYK